MFEGAHVRATSVDPRDIGQEIDPLAYRVYFYDAAGASDEWRLTETASVVECLEWIDARRADRTFVLYAELWLPNSARTLIHLHGDDPNAR